MSTPYCLRFTVLDDWAGIACGVRWLRLRLRYLHIRGRMTEELEQEVAEVWRGDGGEPKFTGRRRGGGGRCLQSCSSCAFFSSLFCCIFISCTFSLMSIQKQCMITKQDNRRKRCNLYRMRMLLQYTLLTRRRRRVPALAWSLSHSPFGLHVTEPHHPFRLQLIMGAHPAPDVPTNFLHRDHTLL